MFKKTSLFSSLECFLLQSASSCHLQYLLSLAHAFLVILRSTWKFSNAFPNINPIPVCQPFGYWSSLFLSYFFWLKAKFSIFFWIVSFLIKHLLVVQDTICAAVPQLWLQLRSRLCTLMVLPHPILVWYKAAWSTCLLLSQIPVDIPALSVCLSASAAASHLLPPRLCAVRWHIRPPAILNAHTPSNPQSNSNSALLHAIADWHICQTFSIWHIS